MCSNCLGWYVENSNHVVPKSIGDGPIKGCQNHMHVIPLL